MTYYKDLEFCDYFPNIWGAIWTAPLLAVGWLEEGYSYTQGAVDQGFREKLGTLAEDPVEFGSFKGFHVCNLCKNATSRTGPRDGANLFIPSNSVVYIAPRLILHYIDEHNYQPPDEFCEAVQRCPSMFDQAYLKALRDVGCNEEIFDRACERLPGLARFSQKTLEE